MSNTYIQISLKLAVLGGTKVVVPGKEPVSDVTSRALLERWDGAHALVDLQQALDAIPGSYLEYGDNWSGGGSTAGRRRTWLVLPARDQTCPCAPQPDWYKLLGELGQEELPLEEQYDACDVLGQGFCPSPDFGSQPAPPPNPHRTEGGSPYGYTGVLPAVPPWSR